MHPRGPGPTQRHVRGGRTGPLAVPAAGSRVYTAAFCTPPAGPTPRTAPHPRGRAPAPPSRTGRPDSRTGPPHVPRARLPTPPAARPDCRKLGPRGRGPVRGAAGREREGRRTEQAEGESGGEAGDGSGRSTGRAGRKTAEGWAGSAGSGGVGPAGGAPPTRPPPRAARRRPHPRRPRPAGALLLRPQVLGAGPR